MMVALGSIRLLNVLMPLSSALARFMPTDDAYAPFRQRWLRGLNMLPLSLAGLVGLAWFAEGSALALLEPTALAWQFWVRGAAGVFFFCALLFAPMFAGVVAAINLSAGQRSASSVAWVALAVVLGAVPVGALPPPTECLFADTPGTPSSGCSTLAWTWEQVSTFSRAVLWGAVVATMLYMHRRERNAAGALHEAQLRRLQAERQETETRLQSLQAQIEPHFLFNTLAHVQRFHGVDARQGRSMLRSLIEYMRSALPQMRGSKSTLGDELALVNAYVHVQRIRMGERLIAEVDVPDALLDAAVPSMMLLTLAENAVKHGLGPRRQGGVLRIAARCLHRTHLEIEVRDNGVGLHAGGTGGGRGLSNTRARLATLFGPQGVLEIDNQTEGGVRAVVRFPLATVARSAVAS